MTSVVSILELTEFVTERYDKDAFRHETALELRQKHGKQIVVTAPSFFDDCWTLIPQGWIGYIPLTDGTSISIQPKIAHFGESDRRFRRKAPSHFGVIGSRISF